MFNKKRNIIIYALLAILFSVPLHSQGFRGIVKDSMNFAILITNYESYEFEMGHFSTNKLCRNCDSSGLPLELIFELPADFGSITFRYTENLDTLFYAEIVWLGSGNIIMPYDFLPADSFPTTTNFPGGPLSIEYINIIEMDSTNYKNRANSAWDTLKSLKIVNEFSDYLYRVGIYLYTPSVGSIDWSLAKWIVFLYVGNPETNSVSVVPVLPDKFILHQNYPNPFNTSTVITYELPNSGFVTIRVLDVLGNVIGKLVDEEKPSGEYSINFNASNLPSGIYFYRITSGKFTATKKLIILK